MTELTVALGTVFMFFCMGFVLLRSKRLRRVTLLDWAILGMGGIYGGGWALVAFVTKNGGNPFWAPWLLPLEGMYPIHTLSAFILLGATYFGWLLGGVLKFRLWTEPLIVALGRAQVRMVYAAWLLFFIAIVMQWLYTRAYGGFLGLLELSASIRSSIFTVVNPLSFLQPFGGLTIFSSYLFFGFWLDGYRRFSVKFGFVFSFIFSLYILYSFLGRIGFLIYISTFTLGIFLKKRVVATVLLVCGGLILIGILVAAYNISVWLNIKAADNLVSFLGRELSFPFVSFFSQVDSGEHVMRLFRDFLYAPIYLLPSSWWSNWVEDVSQINTALILGAPMGEQGVTGGVPIDMITLGMMQAGGLGVIGVGLTFGTSLRIIQRLLEKVSSLGVRSVFEAHVAIKLAVLTVFYAQPAQVVSGNFDFFFSVVIIICCVIRPRINLFGSLGNVNSFKSTFTSKKMI